MPAPIAANNIPTPAGLALAPLELKAISVPQSLLFLLSSEYDMFLCLTTLGINKDFKLVFTTPLAEGYRMLLEHGARRFGLKVDHTATTSVVSSDGASARMPLLRYVDYIPGGLHVDELLECFRISTKALPRKATPLPGEEAEGNVFKASFIDYSPYASDEALLDVHGCGYYLTIDYGLSLATHSHLLSVTFVDRKDGLPATGTGTAAASSSSSSSAYAPALASFIKFTGWETLDIRFEDESRRTAVVVFPSTQDANDVLERYENEESDNELDEVTEASTAAVAVLFRPPFHIRPIAPTVSVPYIEDAVLRRLRAQHWPKVEAFWEHCAANKNTLSVGNLYDGVTLEEVQRLFNGRVVSAAMTEDDSPAKRRRVFLTFATSDEAKEALGLDGKNTHGKSLKIHTAPPYVDISRRGKVISSKGLGGASPSAASTPVAAGAPAAPTPTASSAKSIEVTAGGESTSFKSPCVLNAGAKEFIPKFTLAPPAGVGSFALPPPYTGSSGASPSAPPACPPPPAYLPSSGGAGVGVGIAHGGVSPMAMAALPPAYGPPPPLPSPAGPVYSPPPPSYPPPPIAGKSALPPPAYAPSPAGKSPDSPIGPTYM